MIRPLWEYPSDGACIPRESGDDPPRGGAMAGCSAVFPARAGMIPAWRERHNLGVRIPRESGDDPTRRAMDFKTDSYSPRERG